jgi:hypothetical protein
MEMALLRCFRLCTLKLVVWTGGVGVDIDLEGFGFLAYRLERASEPNGSRANMISWRALH